MSSGPRLRSTNLTDSDSRPVLVPAGNNRTPIEPLKPHRKSPEIRKQPTLSPTQPPMRNLSAPSILRRVNNNLSMSASCSSDASSDSSHSRASSIGKSSSKRSTSSLPVRRKQGRGATKLDKVVDCNGGVNGGDRELGGSGSRKRCAWVTPNTDPSYAKFHDEEWGVPVHDDNKLFELLSFAVALAELTWPTILNKRNAFREVFLDFDPVSVSKLNDKKIGTPGSLGSTVLSELKLRNIVENARQVCKITDEFGSFDKYIWGFMNHKPIVNKFRYPRQVPVKTSKADVISKDLVRRGFRGVGPTVVYSFMQAAGLTNDHLVTCFRYQECAAAGEGTEKEDPKVKIEEKKPGDIVKLELARALDEMSICSD